MPPLLTFQEPSVSLFKVHVPTRERRLRHAQAAARGEPVHGAVVPEPERCGRVGLGAGAAAMTPLQASLSSVVACDDGRLYALKVTPGSGVSPSVVGW